VDPIRAKIGVEDKTHDGTSRPNPSARTLEIGCLSGAALELADRLGVQAPTTRALHACVELLERVRDEAAAAR
jgi:hypothetical protein